MTTAKVFIWETRAGRAEDGSETTVGHASLQINNEYVSFRPKNSLMVNPLTVMIPTVGTLYKSLQEDIDHEGAIPDRVISVSCSEESTLMKIRDIRREVAQEKRVYQLLPGLFPIVQSLASKTFHDEMTRCPFTGESIGGDRYRDYEGLKGIKSGHCSSTVAELLDIPQSTTPWKITPTELGNALEKSYLKRV